MSIITDYKFKLEVQRIDLTWYNSGKLYIIRVDNTPPYFQETGTDLNFDSIGVYAHEEKIERDVDTHMTYVSPKIVDDEGDAVKSVKIEGLEKFPCQCIELTM